ncbi:MAG: hypothetical protein GY950_17250 [bacterium]|nr:hypothetical protein [bacterium]
MKTKKIQKKLTLQKETVANLETAEMKRVHGKFNYPLILSEMLGICPEAAGQAGMLAVDEEDVKPSGKCEK